MGLPGSQGPQGRQGDAGEQGTSGRSPGHEVKNGEIRFLQPDGQWGEWLSLGNTSGGGPISFNTYIPVTVSDFHCPRSVLTLGTNILGVRIVGPVTIWIPKSMDTRSYIVIKDETGTAGGNNITIKVEI